MSRSLHVSRRDLGRTLAFGASAIWVPGVFADMLTETAGLTEGPFYPDRLPRDTDNDLLFLNDSITPAVGEVTHLSGRVLRASGAPVRNAFVEIWQVDANAVYLHSGSGNAENRDSHFQGYGRFLTDSKGRYYFRTIKPVPYPGRTPHIHIAVSLNGQRKFTSQILIEGHPQNEKDGVLRSVRDAQSRATVMAAFNPLQDSQIGELEANFDVVLGVTASEDDAGQLQGTIGAPQWKRRRR
ncbi:MAG: protocatechuate 3,4-dioxygenase [Planctomycetota bacterium]